MALEHELSVGARQRMAALLPDLLLAVRARRRRRHARRAACALLVAALPVLAWQLAPASARRSEANANAVAATDFAIVHDDPTILARCVVTTQVRSEWLLSDDDLQAELRAAQRPAGIVRTNDQVLVSAAAISRWPGDLP